MISREDYSRSNQFIGRRLRKIRLHKGLKQMEVAMATNLNRSYISKIESGKASITLNLLYILVKGLNITSKDLTED